MMKTYNYYKWRIWIILAFSFVMALFHRSALGAISSDVSNSLGLTALELSNLASITFYTYAMMQIPAGILLDKLGYKKTSTWGMIFTGLGSILFGFTNHLFVAYLSRIFIGLGSSVIFISILKAQQIWFTKEDFTKASGLLSFIGNIGGIVATFPLAMLALLMGWRSSMVLMGVLCLVCALFIHCFTGSSPTDYGFESKGHIPCTSTVSLWVSIKHVLTTPHTWRNFFILFTIVGCTTTLTGLWGIRYLEAVYDMKSTQASFYIAFIIYGLVAGSLCVNKVASLFHGKLYLYPRISCILIASIWGYILFIAEGKPPLSILVILFFIMGFLAMSHILAFTDITDYVSSHNSGLASSIVNSGEFLGSSVIAMCIGTTLDTVWKGTVIDGIRFYDPSSYTMAFSIFFIISLLGVITSFIGTNPKSMK